MMVEKKTSGWTFEILPRGDKSTRQGGLYRRDGQLFSLPRREGSFRRGRDIPPFSKGGSGGIYNLLKSP